MRLFRETILSAMVFVLLLPAADLLAADDSDGTRGRLSVLGGVGVSGARGDYASDYDAQSEFSFSPGIRIRLNDVFAPGLLLLIDLGYLETGFTGHVVATDTDFTNTYEYLNLNGMIGASRGAVYYGAGLYLGIGTGAYSYREYTDDTVDLDANSDFGLVAEVGADLASFLSLGIQGRYGLKSIGTSVDIKNWGLLATVGVHFYRF